MRLKGEQMAHRSIAATVGGVVAIVLVAAGCTRAAAHHPSGTVLGTVDIVSLATVFVYAHTKKSSRSS